MTTNMLDSIQQDDDKNKMNMPAKMTLRESAALAWQEEREARIQWADELRCIIEEMFGTDYIVDIEFNPYGRLVAKIEGLHFRFGKYSDNGISTSRRLMLLRQCDQCGSDVETDIRGLADLGRFLEVLDRQLARYCTGCAGMPIKAIINGDSNSAEC